MSLIKFREFRVHCASKRYYVVFSIVEVRRGINKLDHFQNDNCLQDIAQVYIPILLIQRESDSIGL